MNEETTALNQGIDLVDGPDKVREYADVERWTAKIKTARKHDEEARKQYARDRRYARGDSGFEVDANLVGTFIDILESFLYAKDPDVDVLPAKNVQAPGADAIHEAAEEAINQDKAAQAEILRMAIANGQRGVQEAAALHQAAGAVGVDPASAATLAPAKSREQLLAEATEEYLAREVARQQEIYAERKRDAEAYAETLELVISRLWRDGGLKPRGRRMTRSGLTIGVGLLKASWQERTAPSAETTKAINDLQDNIKRAAALRTEMEDSSGNEIEAQMAEYQRQLQALQGQAEQVIARGFAIDFMPGEDFQIPPGWSIANHLDAPWNAHRLPMLKCEAMAEFGLTKDQMKQATGYSARKPEAPRTESASQATKVEASDADSYVQGGGETSGEGEWCMGWEIWDRESNTVLTLIEGVRCWVKKPWQPTATTRFYPFFTFTTSEVDGERHPQSLVSRSIKLVDEYNRIGSAEAEHRRRIMPCLMFDKGELDPKDVDKITNAKIAEKVGIKPIKPGQDLRTLFAEVNYPVLNPAIYDRSRIVAELERIWGIQEALSGSIDTAKTATEAEIQQSGFTARTGGRRDLLENMLSDLAQYTAEVARAHLDEEDVRRIAGPDALWPQYKGAADLADMVQIEIRAGSSGKPNTSADRAAWASQLPLLQSAIKEIGTLRGSTPTAIADGLEELLRITAERSGDRLNIDRLIPKPGPGGVPTPGGMPGEPNEVPAMAGAAPNAPLA